MSRCSNIGFIVVLAGGSRGVVDVTDSCDDYDRFSLDCVAINSVVTCYVLDASKKRKLVLSTRPSRFDLITQSNSTSNLHEILEHSSSFRLSNDKSVLVKDREVLLPSQLHEGDVIRGFVTKSEATSFSIMYDSPTKT